MTEYEAKKRAETVATWLWTILFLMVAWSTLVVWVDQLGRKSVEAQERMRIAKLVQ